MRFEASDRRGCKCKYYRSRLTYEMQLAAVIDWISFLLQTGMLTWDLSPVGPESDTTHCREYGSVLDSQTEIYGYGCRNVCHT